MISGGLPLEIGVGPSEWSSSPRLACLLRPGRWSSEQGHCLPHRLGAEDRGLGLSCPLSKRVFECDTVWFCSVSVSAQLERTACVLRALPTTVTCVKARLWPCVARARPRRCAGPSRGPCRGAGSPPVFCLFPRAQEGHARIRILGRVPAATRRGAGAGAGEEGDSLEAPQLPAWLPDRPPLPSRSRCPFTRHCRLPPSWGCGAGSPPPSHRRSSAPCSPSGEVGGPKSQQLTAEGPGLRDL